MVPYILLIALLPLILILYFQSLNSKHGKKLHPPGPPRLPIIGNLHQFDGQFPHTYLHSLSKQYGPIMSLKLGFRRVLVISSADAVKEIMKNDVVFSSRPNLVSLNRMSYNGLDVAFSPYSDTWREMRKICTIHLFSNKQLLQSFRPIFRDEVSKMMQKIAMDASQSMATDMSETMMSFAYNIISRVALGKSYGDEGYGKNRFIDVLYETQAVLGGFFVEDYLPWFRWMDILSGMAAKLHKNFLDMNSFIEEEIEEHMNPNRLKSVRGDIIDILLGIKRDGSSSINLTLDHIKALLLNIITGGSDTTSTVLVWAMTALVKNPLVMKKVQAEIRQVAGKKDLVDEEDIEKRLPYLRAIVKETLRLYPPAPILIARETIQKCSIHGYEIEGGTMVYINAWAIARDPATWENADEFVPERFLDSDLDVRGQSPEVIPFGIGRRGCPAIGIGMAEVELGLANVLNKFEWELPPGMKGENIDFDVLPGMTMHKKNALCLVAKVV